jgi:LemA protein
LSAAGLYLKIAFMSAQKKKLPILLILVALITLSSCGVQAIPRQENEVESAWSEVLNQYQRRADLVPNLVNTVKGYAKHEQDTLTKVVEARANATKITLDAQSLTAENVQKLQKAQQELSGALSRLLAVAENYPDLKANQNFRDLQVQLEGTENRISVARNRYIETVKDFNNLITVFPTSLTNSLLFHKSKKAQFTVANEAEVSTPPKVEF